MGLKGYRLWAMGQLDSTCRAPPRQEHLVGDEGLPLCEVQVHVLEARGGGAAGGRHRGVAREQHHHLFVAARDEAQREDVALAREVALQHHLPQP
jgi:hypothetical protein